MAVTQVRVRRIAVRVVLALGGLLTGLGLLLIIAGWTEDAKIDGHTGRANAEVVSVSFQRTLVRFQTPDGAEHIPSVGVLYPEALEEGQTVQVEYDLRNPELVRVAGRGTLLMLLPVGTTVLLAWAVLLPVVWWLRRRPDGV
ncbi:MAG TPA: DUF3592 domain-containing protein [Actinophytocola sp.]|uniref:DUF3592 domain-containing protein n=1 Tax=Actinophytocola sp. TaxID=1872138 RepID=UPI002DDD73CC|nr:DUF3592 domain-containing protein [Actinophytocola sp.]HEV2779511.1 DUF3592 domain-containing protein [Actinophytocola sp.]